MRRVLSIFMVAAFTLAIGFSTAAYAGGDAAAGKALFNNKKKGGCKTCHKITAKKLVGPGLKGVMGKHSEGWMHKWLTDPKKTWEENDSETAEMKTRLKRVGKKKTRMKVKGKLSSADVDNLIAYLKTL